MRASPEPSGALLRHRPFALLWSSRVLANVGFHMLSVAVGWQLYALTGSALDLGLVGLVQFVPVILLTLVVGQVADRYDRRLIATVCHVLKALAVATLVLGTLGGWQSKTSILAIVSLIGAARAFENPAMTALVPEVVPRPLIARGMAWVVSANQTAQIVGPALGGFLYALAPAAAYAAAGALFGVAAICVPMIRSRRSAPLREPVALDSVFSGIAFIWSRPVLLGAMSLDLFAGLLGGGATALLPIFARDILGTGPLGLGLLRSAPAVGALVTSVLLARYPVERRLGRNLFSFESGLAAALVGAVPAVLIGGIGTIALAGLWMVLFPALRRTRSFEP